MSHFSCLAVGRDLERIMEPYCEQDENYFKPVEDSEEYLKEVNAKKETFLNDEKFLDKCGGKDKATFEKYIKWYYGYNPCTTQDEEEQCIADKQSYVLLVDGNVVKMVYFTNPNARWDWYDDDEGGRFGSNIRTKNGEYVCHGTIGEIDIDGMLEEKRKKLADEYDSMFAVVGHVPAFAPWRDYADRIDKGQITRDEARTLFYNQPDVKLLEEWAKKMDYWSIEHENYMLTREEYIAQANLPLWCANINGEWLEKGKMGWWAISLDKKQETEWKGEIVSRLREEIEKDPEQEFWYIDCHI